MVFLGMMNKDRPINKEDQPIKVMISFQSKVQMLWNKMFNSPIIMAIKDEMIKNF